MRGPPRKAVISLARYFQNNAERMDYSSFKARGLPIGSGAVESSHRHVLQTRMKLAGQHWSPPAAHRMVLLRTAYKTAGPQAFAENALPLAA